MSETSLTDEIMMALRDKLNDPSLYCTVLDAKAGSTAVPQEDLYCSPLYVDPNQLKWRVHTKWEFYRTLLLLLF